MTEPIPPPTEAFFNSQPAAGEIRRLTLVGLGSCVARLHGDESPTNTAEITGASGALRQWGVSEAMHQIPPDRDPKELVAHGAMLMATPRLASEFVAGQFLQLLQDTDNLPMPDRAELRQYGELNSETENPDPGIMLMIDMDHAPEPVRNYAIQLGTLSTLMSMLDHTGERLHDETLASGQPYSHPLLNRE